MYNYHPDYLELPAHLRTEYTDPNSRIIFRSTNEWIPYFRYGIFASNIVHIVVGALLMASGIYLRTDSRFRDFLSERYRQAVGEAFWEAPTLFMFSYIMIVLGAFMLLASFFGCCGVTDGSRVLTSIYSFCIFSLLCINIGCISYLMYMKDAIDVELSDALNYMVQHYYQGPGVVQESLDNLQQAFRCCGNAGCSDFRAFRMDTPRTCDLRCDGCHYRISVAIRIGFSIAVFVLLAVVVCEFIALFFALHYIFIGKEDREFRAEIQRLKADQRMREEERQLTRENVESLNLQTLGYRGHEY